MFVFNWEGRRLCPTAFTDTSVQVSSLSVIKDFMIVGDASHSLRFVRWDTRSKVRSGWRRGIFMHPFHVKSIDSGE